MRRSQVEARNRRSDTGHKDSCAPVVVRDTIPMCPLTEALEELREREAEGR